LKRKGDSDGERQQRSEEERQEAQERQGRQGKEVNRRLNGSGSKTVSVHPVSARMDPEQERVEQETAVEQALSPRGRLLCSGVSF